MGKIVYSMNLTLDGYIEDSDGSIGFSEPPDDVHHAENEQTADTAAFLFGRGLYEMMEEPWTEIAAGPDPTPNEAEFAEAYFGTPRIVFSDTLEQVPDGVRLVRSADAVAEVTRLKRDTDGMLAVGGPGLAASLLDLVDEFWLYLLPVTVGGGKPYFPLGEQLRLRLVGHRVFDSGVVLLRYERAG